MRKVICILWLTGTLGFTGVKATAAVSVPSDPALDVSVSISGRFINLLTGEAKEVALHPELIWVTPDELPPEADSLRPALSTQWNPAVPRANQIWERWKHRAFQSLNAPNGWEMWEASSEPLTLNLTVRDKHRRLRAVRVLTADGEQVVNTKRSSAAQGKYRISPSGSAVLVLQGQQSALMVVLMHWTPVVRTGRMSDMVDCPPFTPVHLDCEECRQGEAVVKRARPDLPLPESGFYRVYRHVEANQNYPSGVPHFEHAEYAVLAPDYMPHGRGSSARCLRCPKRKPSACSSENPGG